MGGDNSGRYTSRSKSWDLLDFMWAKLNQLERSVFDESAILNREWIETTKAELQRLQGQFKDALERERKG